MNKGTLMKAMVYQKYGSPDVLELKEVEKPTPKDNEVLVKVHAASLNASDWEFLTGTPSYVRAWGLFKPKNQILGSDIAGQVEAVGKNVKQFQPGDKVFGDTFGHWGGLAEYVCAHENALVPKPTSMTYEEVAAIPQAGVVALQGLRDKGRIQQGQKVLIIGAGGGSGTFAIQLAKLFGTEVTGVDSTEKLDKMSSIGADHVVDYTQEDFTKNGKHYDLILDFVSPRSVSNYRHSLSPGGNYVMVGGSIPRILQMLFMGPLISITGSKKMGMLLHRQNKKDINLMIELFETSEVKPIIDKTYPLNKTPEAFSHIGEGHAKGKIVITV